MVVDVIALLLLAGVTYLILFNFTKDPDDPSCDVVREEKIYDPAKKINKFNL